MNILLKINRVIRLLTICYLCLYCIKAEAQIMDRIIKKDSTEMYVIVQKMEDDSITYRFYGQPKDSLYAISNAVVSKIVLKNGRGNYYPKPVLYQTDGTIKPPKFSPIYVDAAVGFFLTNDRIYGLADLNIGYRFNEKQAIGISRIGMSDYSISASGVGIQYRLTPQREVLFKLELGVITSASSIDRSGPEIYTYLPKNSSNVYLRVGLGVRVGSFVSLSINYIGTGSMTFQISEQNMPPSRTSWSGSIGFFCPQIGIALPSIPKKVKR